MFILYYAPNTCAFASLITLIEAGATYKLHRLNFGNAEQRQPDYLDINPKGRVPALVTPHGILTETPAILAFIAQSFPASRLAPLDDPIAFAQMQAFNSYLCSTVHVAHAHRTRGSRWADDPVAIADMKRKVPETMGDCFDLIERKMFKGPWVTGETYTVADPYLFTISQWLEGDSIDIASFPAVFDHSRRMRARTAVQRATAEQLENAA